MPPSVAGDYTRWSDCSVEDFTKMVNQKPTCLKEIDPSNPPIEIEKQPLEPRECDMNKQYPGLNGYANFNYFGEYHVNMNYEVCFSKLTIYKIFNPRYCHSRFTTPWYINYCSSKALCWNVIQDCVS